MTLNLSEKEMQVLTELANQKGMTKTALLRQALRLYQHVEIKQQRGQRLLFEDNLKKITELVVI